ncbi:MAG: O-sialoglycoprotein endopeptidase [Clostridia bacterium]|nr:O-sialoglycoprotein endopeptidase [Clostridia bacterium]
MKAYSLGIDTSCYTTSLVAIDETNKIVYAGRKLLKVKKGTVGLRQSDAFFQHVQNLPELYHACTETIDVSNIKNIVVSTKPRPIEDSYMPVFMAGAHFARVISDTLKIPLIELSHQENHLFASAYNHELPRNFIGVHISGGTTEILKVSYDKIFNLEIIGHTLDISFGKLIDRVGVHMGFDFPCGKTLDHLARKTNSIYPFKYSIKENAFNVSGLENKLKFWFDEDLNPEKVSRTMFYHLGNMLLLVLENLKVTHGLNVVVLSGGVSANTIIREILKNFSGEMIFTDIEYATDHAVGNSYYGMQVRL